MGAAYRAAGGNQPVHRRFQIIQFRFADAGQIAFGKVSDIRCILVGLLFVQKHKQGLSAFLPAMQGSGVAVKVLAQRSNPFD